MLRIRSSQKEQLNAYSLNQYKAELCEHLGRYDPLLCQAAGSEALKDAVDLGLQRAHGYGFRLNGPIRTYLEIMLALGSDFDRDPQYAWLIPWLRPQERYQEMDRARHLQFHVVRYLDDIQGYDGSNGIEALKRVQGVTRDQLIEVGRNYPENAMDWLKSIHPLKCQFIGNDALQSLILSARKEAVRAELQRPESIPLVLGLAFALGIGILHDPMHPWATRSLVYANGNGDASREERLLRRGKVYLSKMLQQIQGVRNNV